MAESEVLTLDKIRASEKCKEIAYGISCYRWEWLLTAGWFR